MPTGADDGSSTVVDGRVGTALIQEYRFNQYCKRLQHSVASTFDFEFKMFLNWKGYNIDSSMFELRMNEPQNFAAYRQAEIDSQRASLFTSLSGVDYLSKRFLLKRFLGLSEEEVADNDRMWAEENGQASLGGTANQELRGVGVTPGDLNQDFDTLDTDTGGDEDAGGDLDLDLDVTDTGGDELPADDDA